MTELVLPWPPKELSPNQRTHWAAKAKAAKAYRAACYTLTKASCLRVDWQGEIHAWIDFYPPDRRHRDDDNVFASFKSGRDGMAEALGIDDVRIRMHPWLKPEIGGMVKVRLTPIPSLPDQIKPIIGHLILR